MFPAFSRRPYIQYTQAYIRTAPVLEVYTLTVPALQPTLDLGCGSFSGRLCGCMETHVTYGFTEADTYTKGDTQQRPGLNSQL